MGANRTLATPDLYPAIFHAVLRNGLGIIYASDTPWTAISCAKRFRLFLALLRKTPTHPLYGEAKARWAVRPHGGGVEIRRISPGQGQVTSMLNGALVDRGLGILSSGTGAHPGPVVNPTRREN